MSRPFTLEALRNAGACEDALATFGSIFRAEVKVTRANALRAVRAELDLDWAASRLLPPAALAEWRKATAAAWAEYRKATAAAQAEWEKATAAAFVKVWREGA